MKPSDLYQQQIQAGAIQSDAAQAAALVHFDQVHQQVLQAENRSWLQRLRSQKPPKGLYLRGGVGTGKTLLMDMFYRSLPECLGKRIHFHRFMQSVHEQKSAIKDQQRPLKIIAESLTKKHRVLCLDEFAVTDITDAMILYGLLDALFSSGITLITTSNIPQVDLYKGQLQRDRFLPAIELLKIHTLEIEVDSGNDYRMAYLQNDSIYHQPLNDAAEQAMETCFENLAGMFDESKTAIKIGGRDVAVIATGSGVVWFEFSILCQGNRSKVDYIELSKRFHTLLLSKVPVLDDMENDATRRFIELIDELYDRGVNLILSAAATPESLYTGARLAMPFQRTVSRLQEMSSTEYLSRPHLP